MRIYVSYIYWDNNFDEWISNVCERFAPLHHHTYTEGGVLKYDQRIEAFDERERWVEAFVCDESNKQVFNFIYFYLDFLF